MTISSRDYKWLFSVSIMKWILNSAAYQVFSLIFLPLHNDRNVFRVRHLAGS